MPPVLSVRTAPVEIERPDERPPLPNPAPIEEPREIEWKVLTPETLPVTDDWVFFGLSPEDYEDLSTNTAELLRWIQEAQWRLQYYRGEDNQSQEEEE